MAAPMRKDGDRDAMLPGEHDRMMLRECIEKGNDEPWVEPFENMLDDLDAEKWPTLTERQRAWVKGVHAKLFGEVPEYLNLVSSGRVPRGRDVPTPEVLTRRPLKPPGRL